jgi:Na+/melibiose symporter-like transporter
VAPLSSPQTGESAPDSQAPPQTQPKKLSFWTTLAYSSGAFGNNLIYGIMTLYLMVFYTDYFGIPAAAVGTLFLLVRVWDAVANPVMGMLVDNTRSRWGKFRPYLLFVPFAVAITTTLCFASPDLGPTGKLIYAYVTYILCGMSFTAIDIPYWSMSASLTEDPKERNTIVMLPRTMGVVGFNIVAIITLPIVHFLGRGNGRVGFFFTAMVFSLGAMFFTFITFFACRENVQVAKKEHTSLKDALGMIRLNRPLQLVVGGQLIIDIIYCIKGALPIYYMKYVLDAEKMVVALNPFLPPRILDYVRKMGPENFLISLSMVIGMAFMLAGCLLAPWFCSKLGKKWVTVWGNVIAAAAGIIFYFMPYSIMNFFGFGVIVIFGTSMANISLMSMLMDTVEYGEWKTGKRLEGVIFSLNTFRAQLSGAIGGAMGAYALAAVKYVPNVAQTPQTIRGIHFFFALVPGILSLLATVPYFFYDLTEERYETILKEVVARREGVNK